MSAKRIVKRAVKAMQVAVRGLVFGDVVYIVYSRDASERSLACLIEGVFSTCEKAQKARTLYERLHNEHGVKRIYNVTIRELDRQILGKPNE